MSAEATLQEAQRFLREHAHYREDLGFWRAHARRLGGPVLDLGAAGGRVAITLAGDGHEVWALDRSPQMLDALTDAAARAGEEVARRIHPLEADMRSFSLERRFPLVAIAMNTLQALTEPADQLACLGAAAAHLAPGGELIFDVAHPDPGEIAEGLGEVREGGSFVDPLTGIELHHAAWYDSWDPLTQTLEFTHRIVEVSPGGDRAEFLRRHRVHLFMPVELDHLIARAGLRTIETTGDFAGGPLRAGGETQIRRCAVAA
ncbi:MAG: class I SAM-dependent methyltransferase [Miltoncostaeaceae bacterium]